MPTEPFKSSPTFNGYFGVLCSYLWEKQMEDDKGKTAAQLFVSPTAADRQEDMSAK
jgi:hypothetical protein